MKSVPLMLLKTNILPISSLRISAITLSGPRAVPPSSSTRICPQFFRTGLLKKHYFTFLFSISPLSKLQSAFCSFFPRSSLSTNFSRTKGNFKMIWDVQKFLVLEGGAWWMGVFEGWFEGWGDMFRSWSDNFRNWVKKKRCYFVWFRYVL